MITIEKKTLRAALECAADKEVRYYLNGVYLEVADNGDLHTVATDGNILFAGVTYARNVAWYDKPQIGMRIIIPRDVIKREIAGKGSVNLIALDNGQYQLSQTVFAAVDGTFPDWRRVCPSYEDVRRMPAQIGHYSFDLMQRGNEALRTWFDGRKGSWNAFLYQRGTREAGVMTGNDASAFIVIMPLRADDMAAVDHFTPAPLTK